MYSWLFPPIHVYITTFQVRIAMMRNKWADRSMGKGKWKNTFTGRHTATRFLLCACVCVCSCLCVCYDLTCEYGHGWWHGVSWWLPHWSQNEPFLWHRVNAGTLPRHTHTLMHTLPDPKHHIPKSITRLTRTHPNAALHTHKHTPANIERSRTHTFTTTKTDLTSQSSPGVTTARNAHTSPALTKLTQT